MKRLWALIVILGTLAACAPAQGVQVAATDVSTAPAAEVVTATQVSIPATATSAPVVQPLDPAAAAALLQERCTVCHSEDRINRATKTQAEWMSTIDRMIGHGAIVSPEEHAQLAMYLANR